MDAVAEAALEAVPVEQGQEQLEVLLLAVVRRRRHQQEVAGQAREELPQAVPFRVLDLAAEERGRQLVGLVAHDQVPARVRRLQLLLHVLVARQLVQTGDDQVGLEEPVAGAGGFELVVGQDLERKLESAVQLVLPLLGEAAGADDQAPLQVAAGDQLLDQQPRHDGLARAGVVGEQEAQRLARQHRVVDAGDLVRQRVDHRRVDRQQRVEQVREADALRLGHQPEQRAVAVEAPRPPLGDDLEPGLVVAVEQFVGDRARLRLVGQLDRLRAEPLHADNGHYAVGMHAPDSAARSKVFELHGVGSEPELNMRPEAHQSQRAGVGLLVDQDQVGLDVAIAVIGPLTAQCMVVAARGERLIGGQGLDEGRETGVERGPMPALRLPLVVALEPARALNRPHADRRTDPARCRTAGGCPGGPP